MTIQGNTPVERKRTASAPVAVTVTTATPVQVLAANDKRADFIIQNVGDYPVWLGFAWEATSANGIKLAAGEAASVPGWLGAVYARASGGSSEVRVVEFGG